MTQKYMRRHVSLREDIYEYLEKTARELGFTSVAGYITHLAVLDRARRSVPPGSPLETDYLRVVSVAGYVPYTMFTRLLEKTLEWGRMETGCWDAYRAYTLCSREHRDMERLCAAIADIAAEKMMLILVSYLPQRCGTGYTVVLDASRGKKPHITVCGTCHPVAESPQRT